MDFNDVVPFFETHKRGVIATRRPNGATHSSIVVCGAYEGNAAFVSVYPALAEDPQPAPGPELHSPLGPGRLARVGVSRRSGDADRPYSNTDAEEMRVLLRKVYMACSHTEHPDWEEYDQAMVDQEAVIVLVKPERVYGLVR